MTCWATVVFADISGSTTLFETLGNEAATKAVTQLTSWIAQTLQSGGGRVIKKLGDGVLGVFDSPEQSLISMAELLRQHQQRLSRWPAAVAMHIRIGVASGDVVQIDGDCYGDAVNVASRLCERAGPAEIWVSDAAKQRVGAAPGLRFRKLGLIDLRGKAEPLMVHQLEWRQDEEPDVVTMQAALASQFSVADSILGTIEFSWYGVDYRFSSDDAPVHIGRAVDAELSVNDPRVSRLHARIDWRRNTFVLTDLSSFGTWVRFEGSDAAVRLRRDSCILHGSGALALGVSFSEPAAPVLRFQVSGTQMHLG